MHGHRVAAEPEEHALAEGEHAALAPGQADAERDDREAEVLGQQAEPEVGSSSERGHDQGQHGATVPRRPAAVPCDGVRTAGHVSALDRSTNRPCGRNWRKATIAANTMTLARLASVQNSA